MKVIGTVYVGLATEWKEFRTPNFDDMASRLKDKIIFDGRNLYDRKLLESFDLAYASIGRP